MEVSRLTVVIDGDSSGADRALDNVEGALGNAEKATGRVGRSMTRNVTAPIVGVVGAMAGLATRTASSADEVIKGARAGNISTDAYQELQYALGQAGLGQSSFQRLLDRNNQRLGRAADGTEKYQEAYDSLGVAITDTNGDLRAGGEVFEDVLAALGDIEDPAQRAAAASELLGTKAGRELAASLDGGNDALAEARDRAHEMSAVMGDEALHGAEDFMDGIDDLKHAFDGVLHTLGSELMPVLHDMLPLIEDSIVPALQSFAESVASLIEWFVNLPAPVQKTIGVVAGLAAAAGPILGIVSKLIGLFKVILPLFKALAIVGKILAAVVVGISLPVLAVIAAIAALIAIGVLLWKNWDKVTEMAGRAWDAVKRGVSSAVNWVGERISSLVDWFRRLPGRIAGALAAVPRMMLNAGKNIINSLWNGIKSVASKPVDAVKDVVGSVRNFLPFSPAKEGPFSGSGSPEKSGRAITGDLADGIAQNAAQVRNELLSALASPDATATGIDAATLTGAPSAGAGQAGVTLQVSGPLVDLTVEGDMDREVLAEMERRFEDQAETVARKLADAIERR